MMLLSLAQLSSILKHIVVSAQSCEIFFEGELESKSIKELVPNWCLSYPLKTVYLRWKPPILRGLVLTLYC